MAIFNLFRKKSELERMNEKYLKLLKEAHMLSQRDRRASDLKMQEAEEVSLQIEKIKASEKE